VGLLKFVSFKFTSLSAVIATALMMFLPDKWRDAWTFAGILAWITLGNLGIQKLKARLKRKTDEQASKKENS
jgi:hypothetical protein